MGRPERMTSLTESVQHFSQGDGSLATAENGNFGNFASQPVLGHVVRCEPAPRHRRSIWLKFPAGVFTIVFSIGPSGSRTTDSTARPVAVPTPTARTLPSIEQVPATSMLGSYVLPLFEPGDKLSYFSADPITKPAGPIPVLLGRATGSAEQRISIFAVSTDDHGTGPCGPVGQKITTIVHRGIRLRRDGGIAGRDPSYTHCAGPFRIVTSGPTAVATRVADIASSTSTDGHTIDYELPSGWRAIAAPATYPWLSVHLQIDRTDGSYVYIQTTQPGTSSEDLTSGQWHFESLDGRRIWINESAGTTVAVEFAPTALAYLTFRRSDRTRSTDLRVLLRYAKTLRIVDGRTWLDAVDHQAGTHTIQSGTVDSSYYRLGVATVGRARMITFAGYGSVAMPSDGLNTDPNNPSVVWAGHQPYLVMFSETRAATLQVVGEASRRSIALEASGLRTTEPSYVGLAAVRPGQSVCVGTKPCAQVPGPRIVTIPLVPPWEATNDR
jgi:hypothetical protein